MARIRSIKPEFWVSEQVAECSTSARLTFVGLWTFSDDNGVHAAKPKKLKAELYPMDDVSAAEVAGWMDELIRVGLVAEFEAGGERFWHVTGWARHQKIDRPSFKYPPPPVVAEQGDQRSTFVESSANTTLESTPSAPSTQRAPGEASSKPRRAPPPGVDRSGVDRSGVQHSPKARPHNVAADAFPDVDPAVLADWLVVRKNKRTGGVTPTVAKGLRAQAEKAGITAQKAIEICCYRGWQSFNASWNWQDIPPDGNSSNRVGALPADEVFQGAI